MFVKCILWKNGKTNFKEERKIIQERLRRWNEGEIPELWQEIQTRSLTLADWKYKVINWIKVGNLRASSRTLEKKELVEDTKSNLELLRSKHPQGRKIKPFTVVKGERIKLGGRAELNKLLDEFPKGTSGGPSGLTIDP